MASPAGHGQPLRELAEVLLRGENSLTSAERETIAAFVSHRNDCDFCHLSHRAAAAHHPGGSYELVDAVRLVIRRARPLSAKLKALLAIAGEDPAGRQARDGRRRGTGEGRGRHRSGDS